MQIVVTKELNPQEHMWLTALSDGMQKQQLKDLLFTKRRRKNDLNSISAKK